MSLGTSKGNDISSQNDSIIAEVFAAVEPDSNRKLSKDIAKVAGKQSGKKFVFYYSPKPYKKKDEKPGVTIVRLFKL